MSGIGIATGKVTGTARLIHHPDEGSRLNPGEVLVAPSTDPSWTPLFIKVAALIMETGGSLSHGAIVAREFGIPAVINVSGVMKVIKDSQTVPVDGEEGWYIFKNCVNSGKCQLTSLSYKCGFFDDNIISDTS
ncbi:PEP-utilizing enzyme [Desulfoscipio gibsoniae]|uniref:PEP-utilizing enzyme n=1 Tax=Desulfoscipio gibsoniae TaxID=102134 RepID=UPI000232ABFA